MSHAAVALTADAGPVLSAPSSAAFAATSTVRPRGPRGRHHQGVARTAHAKTRPSRHPSPSRPSNPAASENSAVKSAVELSRTARLCSVGAVPSSAGAHHHAGPALFAPSNRLHRHRHVDRPIGRHHQGVPRTAPRERALRATRDRHVLRVEPRPPKTPILAKSAVELPIHSAATVGAVPHRRRALRRRCSSSSASPNRHAVRPRGRHHPPLPENVPFVPPVTATRPSRTPSPPPKTRNTSAVELIPDGTTICTVGAVVSHSRRRAHRRRRARVVRAVHRRVRRHLHRHVVRPHRRHHQGVAQAAPLKRPLRATRPSRRTPSENVKLAVKSTSADIQRPCPTPPSRSPPMAGPRCSRRPPPRSPPPPPSRHRPRGARV